MFFSITLQSVFSMKLDPLYDQLTQSLITRINCENGKQPNLQTFAAESWVMHGVNPQTGFALQCDPVTQWFYDQFFTSSSLMSQLGHAVGMSGPIINFDSSMLQTDIDSFLESFVKIAGNPFGRMLLYRILIEIYRNDGKGGGCCEVEEKTLDTLPWVDLLNLRNITRTIFIEKGTTYEFTKNSPAKHVAIIISSRLEDVTVLKDISSTISKGNIVVGLTECPSDVALFHEMLHWFHFLVRPYFSTLELVPLTWQGLVEPETIGHFFYGSKQSVVQNEILISTKPWEGSSENNAAHEDILTICGSDASWCLYYCGSELSENLYRFSQRLPCRVGHGECAYVEDKDVVLKIVNTVINIVKSTDNRFVISNEHCLIDNIPSFCFCSSAKLKSKLKPSKKGVGGMMYP